MDYMRFQINIYFRLLHILTGLSYLLPCYKLYYQSQHLGFYLYLSSSIISALWSLTSYGGNKGLLVKIDVYLAYLIVIYNYYKSFKWITNKVWTNYQRAGFVLTHLAGVVFIIENILINKNIYPTLTYGILHIIWRLFSSAGSWYIFSRK